MTLQLNDVTIIAENDNGYRFGVGRMGGRWIGFACESAHASQVRNAFAAEGLSVDSAMIFVFPTISEGYQLGVTDRDHCILLTGAIAQDPEASYGGVDHWFVGQDLRGKPDDYRCERCDRIGCDANTCDMDYDEYDGD